MKCQCPELSMVPNSRAYMYEPEERDGMNHAPGECKGTYRLKKYLRGDKVLNLCSCCCLFGDQEVPS